MIYTNASFWLLTVPFYTSKLQISSPGLNMLLKYIPALAGVNIPHSSPPGPVFLICGWNSADTAPKPWLSFLGAEALPPAPTLSPSSLPHPPANWLGVGNRLGGGTSMTELAKEVFHTTEQCSAIKAAVLGAETGSGGWLHSGCCSEIIWGSVGFWEQATESQLVTFFPASPFLHLFNHVSWSTKLFQFPKQTAE